MEVKYTKLQTESHLVIQSVKSDLTPALSKSCFLFARALCTDSGKDRVNEFVREEIDTCVPKYLPACDEWTEVGIYKVLVDIIAQVSGRVFVGPELCEDAEYLDCATNYTLDMIDSVTAIKKLRPLFRPWTAPRCAEIHRLRRREKAAAAMLQPMVRQRQEAAKDPNWVKPDDMTQWMMDRGAGDNVSVEELATCQLGLIFAAIHTTSLTATNILYTLASTPEYMGSLREEIRTVMAEHNGNMTTKALQQMEKLDSYMKEVKRLYPPGMSKLPSRITRTQHALTNTSIVYAPRPERHHSLQRPVHSGGRLDRSLLASRLQRRGALPR